MSESWQETEDTLRMSTWWEVLKKEIIYKSVGKAYGTKDRMPGTLGQEHQGDGGTSAGTQRKIRGAGPCRSCGLGGGGLADLGGQASPRSQSLLLLVRLQG